MIKPGIKRIAILGGGPAALFLYKRLTESNGEKFTIDIFEARDRLGCGMPYSNSGANVEHITNVSGNEIPALVTPIVEWIKSLPKDVLKKYQVVADHLTDYMVLPRLLFGEYLVAQFDLLRKKADSAGFKTNVHLNCRVTDVKDISSLNKVSVETNGEEVTGFDHAVICIGHNWPLVNENQVPGFFDSPYPPSKLAIHADYSIAVRGSSLTAIDAIRTLARHNVILKNLEPHKLSFTANPDAQNFRIIMHSRQGLLPGIRFHLDDPRLSNETALSPQDIACHIKENNGFLSLDFIFEKDFKDSFLLKNPELYNLIKDLSMEEFVEAMMNRRERIDPFRLFNIEYDEASKSIRQKESVYWKEMLAVLSFAMNYPAKHFSAEDMTRLQKVLMPLISIVIAFVPQSSCEELIALHEAGRLELISVGDDGDIEICSEGGIIYKHTDEDGNLHKTKYKCYVDCIGQRHLFLKDFPFKTMIENGTVSAAKLLFRNPENAIALLKEGNKHIEAGKDNQYWLKVPGIAIDDNFRIIETTGKKNPRIHMMAVPYIGGYNPDYSGLDFCEEASGIIVKDVLKEKNL